LFYKGFDDFVTNSERIELNSEDYNLASQLCVSMGSFYHDEDIRVIKLMEILQEYFSISAHTFSLKFRNIDTVFTVNDFPLVIIEAKNEVGHGIVDSYMEAIGYYVKELNLHKRFTKCRAPCFLIEVVGPHMMISGAVVAKQVHVDHLIRPVWLVHVSKECDDMCGKGYASPKSSIARSCEVL